MFSYFTGEGTAERRADLLRGLSKGERPAELARAQQRQAGADLDAGHKGLRDPFIIRSPEGDKFYQIATDLQDLRQRRLGRVAAHRQQVDHGVGVHRPGALDQPATGQGLPGHRRQHLGAGGLLRPQPRRVRRLLGVEDLRRRRPDHTGNTYNKMMYATTRDFYTFSEPKVWKDPGYSVIDSTMIENNGTYYRFTKDERNNTSSSPCSKFIIEEKSASIREHRLRLRHRVHRLGRDRARRGTAGVQVEHRGQVVPVHRRVRRPRLHARSPDDRPGLRRRGPRRPATRCRPARGTARSCRSRRPSTTGCCAPYQPDQTVTTGSRRRVGEHALGHGPGAAGHRDRRVRRRRQRAAAVTWDAVRAVAVRQAGHVHRATARCRRRVDRGHAEVTVAKEPGRPADLLLHYKFDENGGTVVRDSSGHGYDGTYVNYAGLRHRRRGRLVQDVRRRQHRRPRRT